MNAFGQVDTLNVTGHEVPHGLPGDPLVTGDVMVLRRLVLIESVAHFVRQQCPDEIAVLEGAVGHLDAEQICGMLKAMRSEPADYEVSYLEAMELIARWREKSRS